MAATRVPRQIGRILGQTGTEYMLVISVITISVVASAYVFVQPFTDGVNELGNDVKEILGGQSIGGVGRGGPGVNGATPQTGPGTGGPANGSVPESNGPGTEGLGTPSNNGTNRSYDGRIFSNSTDVAWDPKANDPLRDILGPGTTNRLNGMPSMPVMTASAPRRSDTELARASVPAPRVAVLRNEEDA